MQATHDSYADPSSSTSNLKKGRQHEDMKGAQFVVQSNLKIMSRCIAALSKISEDVLIEVSDSGLYFKVVNRSKFCVFRFAPEFFNSCDLTMINKRAVNICRLSMKSAQRIFKGVAFGEKNFVGCEFRIDPRGEKLMVKFQMNYDIERTIHAKLREMGSVLHKPTYDRTACRNTTVVFASTLIPILAQMKSDVEVTIKVNENGITIRNFHSSDGVSMFNMADPKGGKKVKTETTIVADKLTRHKVKMAVEFSFSLKEFMSIVTFADQLGSEVCLYYDLPGKPIIVSIEAHPNFDIELALATMGNDDEVDLDGGVVKETLINHEAAKNSPSVETFSRPSSKKSSIAPELEISSSGSRPRRGPIPQSQVEEQAISHSEHSKNRFIEPGVEERTSLPDQSWRDNEIVINDEQREPSPEVQVVEQMDVQEYIPYDAMQEERQQNVDEDLTMHQAMQDVNIGADNSTPPMHETQGIEYYNRTDVELVDETKPMMEFHEQNDEFEDPSPKRMKITDDRNKKLRRILMGTGPREIMRMSQQFKGLPLIPDTQY